MGNPFKRVIDIQEDEFEASLMRDIIERSNPQRIVAAARKEEGYVYLLHNKNGTYKIGVTSNLNQRVVSINATSEFGEMDILFAAIIKRPYDIERLLQAHFRKSKVRGKKDWFQLNLSQAKAFVVALGLCGAAVLEVEIDNMQAIECLPVESLTVQESQLVDYMRKGEFGLAMEILGRMAKANAADIAYIKSF